MYTLLPEHFESPLGTVQVNKSVRNTPASFAFTQVLHRSNNTLKSLSICGKGEMEHKGQQR